MLYGYLRLKSVVWLSETEKCSMIIYMRLKSVLRFIYLRLKSVVWLSETEKCSMIIYLRLKSV